MRKDMHKVIVERPRRGARFRLKRASDEDIERLPMRLGPGRHRELNGTRSKSFNDHLAPLERFLAKQVGRPWRKVHQEISVHLDMRDLMKRHVMEHVEDFVQTRAGIGRDGELVGDERSFFCGAPWRQRFYVDPRDGILKVSAKLWRKRGIDPRPWRRRPPASDPNVQRLSDALELHRIEGIWYAIGFGARAGAFDLLRRDWVPAGSRHAQSKHQLCARSLAHYGLSNSADA